MDIYPDGSYYILNIGIRKVETKDIIGLSLWPPEKLVIDKKMKRLRSSVVEKGWHDPNPEDLHLYLIPEGKFTVSTGGNHRSILADELKISRIEAFISLVVPKLKINDKIVNLIEKHTNKIKDIENTAKALSQYLNSKGFERKDYKIEEEQLEYMFNSINELHDEIDELLKNEAIKKKFISLNLVDQIRFDNKS